MAENPPKKDPMRRTLSVAEIEVGKSAREIEDSRLDLSVSEQALESLFPELDADQDMVGDILSAKRDRIALSLDRQKMNQEVRETRIRERKILSHKFSAIAAEIKDLIGEYNKARIQQKRLNRELKRKPDVMAIRRDADENALIVATIVDRMIELREKFEEAKEMLNSPGSVDNGLGHGEITWLDDFFHQNKKLLKKEKPVK